MPRSIWKGAISFGIISIPVRLYSATSSRDIPLHLLHDECGSRVRFLRWCPVHDRGLSPSDIVKGYEHGKGEFVIVTDEDLEKLPIASKHVIALSAFVKDEEIAPAYYEKSYYLEPDETGAKPFALLTRVLEEKAVCGVAKIALRERERLCALRPQDGALILSTLFYADEVLLREASKPMDMRISKPEMEMAHSLVDALTEPFNPEQYRDEYRDALAELIAAKRQGREIVQPPIAAQGKVVDLMAALRASVAAAKDRKRAEPEARPRKASRVS